jgi:two-component system chemotaxis sensor kinase CheA
MAEIDHVVQEFLVESHENLDQLDNELVRLEQDASDAQTLASIFRTVHTIKGTCGFLGFGKLERLTHSGENLLGRLRDGRLSLDAELTSALLEMADAVRAILAQIEATGDEGAADHSALLARLEALSERSPASAAPGVGAETAPPSAPAPAPTAAARPRAPTAPESGPAKPRRLGEVLIARGHASEADIERALERQAKGDARQLGEILVDLGVVTSEKVRESLQQQRSQLADQSIRVSVALLDRLMNLVGELVLTRNQILQFDAAGRDRSFQSRAQRLSQITTGLQEGVMQMRMQPIGTIWDKLPRVARELEQITGKLVGIEMEGRHTELDKTILEAIKDPLTHIIRNAVDHGIEPPAERLQVDKPAVGRLRLCAYHEGGQVNIEVSDDGRGIDLERIRSRAIARALITPEQALRMSDRELLALIFTPGFSTADHVTSVSGRGVGMDVVKTNIEKIGGAVDVQSQRGAGTSIRVKIPLTLAIVPALVIRCAGERYAIPQSSLKELVRVDPGTGSGIEYVQRAAVYRLRGNLLPVVFLDQALGIGAADRARAPSSPHAAAASHLVVLHAEQCPFGLVVDEVIDTQEIVVKPLGKLLKAVGCLAGTTIMGDGRVALILDVQGLADRTALLPKQASAARSAPRGAAALEPSAQTQTLLTFSVGENLHMALPISRVTRLEEFPVSELERAGDQMVVQYRDRILPIVDLASLLGQPCASGERAQVIVQCRGERSVGLRVQRILDVVEAAVRLEHCTDKPGICGSAVVQGRVTDLLDSETVLARVGAGAGGESTPPPA